jgi:hypothetical protein
LLKDELIREQTYQHEGKDKIHKHVAINPTALQSCNDMGQIYVQATWKDELLVEVMLFSLTVFAFYSGF